MTTEAPAQEVPLDREAILRERRRQKVLAGADKRRGRWQKFIQCMHSQTHS